MATKPTHEQAQLHLQVFDMRREARLRQARDWFFKNYFVDTSRMSCESQHREPKQAHS